MPMQTGENDSGIGGHLRDWRQRRRMSQLDLACEANISTRHLSFLENGRAAPSRDMVLRLAEHLEVPLRERNTMLLSAGFAPIYRAKRLNDPAFDSIRESIRALLRAHEPFPALVVDRHWRLLYANRAFNSLVAGVAPALLAEPANVLRLCLHPDGLAFRIQNLDFWRGAVFSRLNRQIAVTCDPALVDLRDELLAYAGGERTQSAEDIDQSGVGLPLQLKTDAGTLHLLSALMTIGTPLDVNLSELLIEIFLPANAETAEILRQNALDFGDGPDDGTEAGW